ncbi:MAG: Secretion system C-terminal sorting domain, partial [Bacteroidota bacterium]
DSIRNLPAASYYFFDDVSLIDITPNGVEEQFTVGSGQLVVYPNPCAEKLLVMSDKSRTFGIVNTIEVTNLLGQQQNVRVEKLTTENCQLNTANLPSGIYFIKATDTKGNVKNGKFVKQ